MERGNVHGEGRSEARHKAVWCRFRALTPEAIGCDENNNETCQFVPTDWVPGVGNSATGLSRPQTESALILSIAGDDHIVYADSIIKRKSQRCHWPRREHLVRPTTPFTFWPKEVCSTGSVRRRGESFVASQKVSPLD